MARHSATWRLLALSLAIIPPITQIAHVLITERRWWPQIYEDDAYYYFGVARSLAEGEGSTFTGLVATNGYQPLWLLVLVPIAAVLQTPHQMVVGVMVLQGVLWLGVVREALRVGRRVASEAVAVAGVAALGVLAVLTGRLSFNGMESAPLLFLLVLALRIGIEAADDDPRADWRFGLVLALICMTRLDAAVTALPLAVVMLRRGPVGVRVARRALRLGGPACVGIGLYAAINVVVFDSALPVSARAKGLGAPFLNLEPGRQLLEAGDALGRPLWFGTVVLLMLAGAWASGRWRHTDQGRRLMAFILAFGLGQLLLLVGLVLGTSYRVWPWYHYNLALIAFGTTLVLGGWASERMRSVGARAGLVLAAAFLVVQAAVTFYPEDPAYAESFSAAQFVRRELPEDAVLAMGDRAGIFGYLADRPLLHLEGLMADADYIRELDDGTATDRMATEGVDYYVRYGPRGAPIRLGNGEGWTFEEPRQGDGPGLEVVVRTDDLVFRDGDGENELTIWRFRPGLNR